MATPDSLQRTKNNLLGEIFSYLQYKVLQKLMFLQKSANGFGEVLASRLLPPSICSLR